jgi:serine/threonine-protein kinase
MGELALVLTIGSDRREFKLLAGGAALVVGRSSDAGLKIDAPLLSRRHFEIRCYVDGKVEVSDLKSANGTFVNGVRAQHVLVRSGDVVRAGDTSIRIEYDEKEEPESSSWITDAVKGDLRCQKCGRLISMSTVDDDSGFEWSEQVFCSACKAGAVSNRDLGTVVWLARTLDEEGFEVLGRLSAEGARVPVFKAKRLGGLEDVVAIKVLPILPDLSKKKIERFKAEARSMAQIKHANVAHVYDVRSRPDLTFIVMEFIEGETLLARIEKAGKVPLLEGLRVGLAISRALEAAEKQKIVHRNVKPANIMIAAQDAVPKLIDFGLAKGVRPSGPAVTDADETLGTLRYMPPEQAKDARAADARSDMYSLAATLYHALTGKIPYSQHSEVDLLRYAVTGKLPEFHIGPGEAIPAGIARVLVRALSAKPEQRYPTPRAFREALAQAVSGVEGGRSLLSSDDLGALGALPAAAAPIAEAAPGVLQGAFDADHPLSEVVQMLGFNSKTGTLAVLSGYAGGDVIFKDGKIVAARTRQGKEGEAAAYEVLALPKGSYEFRPQLDPGLKPTMSRPVEGILLESMKRRDEGKA